MFNQICVKAKVGFDNFMNDQKGVTAIEYAVVGVAVSVMVIAVFNADDTGLKKAIVDAFTKISTQVSGVS